MSPPLLQARNLRSKSAANASPAGSTCDRAGAAPGHSRPQRGRQVDLLATLAGLRTPAGGSVLLGAPALRPAASPREAALRRAWLGQFAADPFGSTVLETALTGRHPHLGRWDWESKRDAELARSALRRGRPGRTRTAPDPHPVGRRTPAPGDRHLLTQATPLYLLDEPLAHLDLNHQMAVLELFAGAARDCGAGVVMVLHDPALAYRFCDRALLIDGDGHSELGPVDAVLTAEKLSALYGYRLRQFQTAATAASFRSRPGAGQLEQLTSSPLAQSGGKRGVVRKLRLLVTGMAQTRQQASDFREIAILRLADRPFRQPVAQHVFRAGGTHRGLRVPSSHGVCARRARHLASHASHAARSTNWSRRRSSILAVFRGRPRPSPPRPAYEPRPGRTV
jgi:iron complex transport system ATP-binding protein